MKIKVKTIIGKTEYEYDIEEQSAMETLHVASVLGNPKRVCNVCEETKEFNLDSNKDKEANIYVNVVCKCGAKSKLGQYKSGGFFWHDFKVFNRDSNTTTNPF